MSWTRDPRQESWLERNGFSYHYVEKVPFARLRRNQERLTDRRIDPDTVTLYALGMLDDDPFPPLIVYKNGKFYDILQGHHRYEAFIEAALDTRGAMLAVYIIDNDDEWTRYQVAAFANCVNGLPLTKHERVMQALETLRRFPAQAQMAVAKPLRLSQSEVSRALRAEQVREVLLANGVKATELEHSKLVTLAKIKNEPAMIASGEIVVRHKLITDDVKDLVCRVVGKRSEAAQLDAVETYEEEVTRFAPKPAVRQGPLPKEHIKRAIRTLFALLAKYPTKKHWGVTNPEEASNLRADTERLAQAMRQALK